MFPFTVYKTVECSLGVGTEKNLNDARRGIATLRLASPRLASPRLASTRVAGSNAYATVRQPGDETGNLCDNVAENPRTLNNEVIRNYACSQTPRDRLPRRPTFRVLPRDECPVILLLRDRRSSDEFRGMVAGDLVAL